MGKPVLIKYVQQCIAIGCGTSIGDDKSMEDFASECIEYYFDQSDPLRAKRSCVLVFKLLTLSAYPNIIRFCLSFLLDHMKIL